MTRDIYYLTGMGGRLDAGLGLALRHLGFAVQGRELVGEFRKFDFQQKIDVVVADLQTHHWHPEALVLANSFGAYVLLHALATLPPFVGKVMLLSPIVGEFGDGVRSINFIPPRDGKLQAWAQSGSYPVPRHMEIHVGSEDWQSNPDNVTALGQMLGVPVTVVANAGHMLPNDHVADALTRWGRP